MAYLEDTISIKKIKKALKRNSTFFYVFAYFKVRSDVCGIQRDRY